MKQVYRQFSTIFILDFSTFVRLIVLKLLYVRLKMYRSIYRPQSPHRESAMNLQDLWMEYNI